MLCNYGYNYCIDPRTYTCEDGHKPTYQEVRSSFTKIFTGRGVDIELQSARIYCIYAERYCDSSVFDRNSPVYSFNGTTGVRQCDSKDRLLKLGPTPRTSCANGEEIYVYKLRELCFEVAGSYEDKELRSKEFDRCDFTSRGNNLKQFISRGDAFCEYVLLYCNKYKPNIEVKS
uniref:Uncharacterized protein n=1 Tax=Tetranychus urticae TaxID=32264 RepID=T1KK28_TETUR